MLDRNQVAFAYVRSYGNGNTVFDALFHFAPFKAGIGLHEGIGMLVIGLVEDRFTRNNRDVALARDQSPYAVRREISTGSVRSNDIFTGASDT